MPVPNACSATVVRLTEGRRYRFTATTHPVARNTLATRPGPRVADPDTERIANILGVAETDVALYSPLALPLGMELGGSSSWPPGLRLGGGKARRPRGGGGEDEGEGKTTCHREIGWDAADADAPARGDGPTVSIGDRMSSLRQTSAGKGSA
jgi:hypothetical protein